MIAEDAAATKAIGQNMRRLRKRLKLTQAQAAAKIIVHQQVWSKWEKGTVVPNPGNLLKIVNLFNVSLDVLFGLEEPPEADLPSADSGFMPVDGLTARDNDGWCELRPLVVVAPIPADCAATPDLYAIMPMDSCIEPFGIMSGNVAYCCPADNAQPGDRVLVKNMDGRLAVKYFVGRDGSETILQGWASQTNGEYAKYLKSYTNSSIKILACIFSVSFKRAYSSRFQSLEG